MKSAERIKGGIRFKEPKSGHARTVSLSSIVIAELKAHRARQAEEQLRLGIRPDADSFVVAQYDGSPIQSRSLTHEWVRILAKTALPAYASTTFGTPMSPRCWRALDDRDYP